MSLCAAGWPPLAHSLLQELLQAAELEHEVVHINAEQLVVRVAQRLVDEQVHRGGACGGGEGTNPAGREPQATILWGSPSHPLLSDQ